jgi:hypothetical protein
VPPHSRTALCMRACADLCAVDRVAGGLATVAAVAAAAAQVQTLVKLRRPGSFAVTTALFLVGAAIGAAVLDAQWKPWYGWTPLALVAATQTVVAVLGGYYAWTAAPPWGRGVPRLRAKRSGGSLVAAAAPLLLDATADLLPAPPGGGEEDDGSTAPASPRSIVAAAPALAPPSYLLSLRPTGTAPSVNS